MIEVVVIIVIVIIVLISYLYNRKQRKKINNVLDIIKNKEGMTITDIANEKLELENSSELMIELYDIYIKFQDGYNNLDETSLGKLTEKAKSFYTNIIINNKSRNFKEVTDNIELIGYSIVEYTESKLKFRIKINCLNYKCLGDKIVGGSDLKKTELILLISYENKDGWLLDEVKKIYEKQVDYKN